MQNPHVKYLKTKKGYFYIFYYEQGSIFCRSYAEQGWTVPEKIAKKTSPVFSLCQYDGIVYLLYADADGQLYLASSNDFSEWEHRSMASELQSTSVSKVFLLPAENAFHLIYHQPTESTGVDSLVYTSFQNGHWEKPYQIDRFMPMRETPFFVRRLQKDHIILYYRTGRNLLSAREMLLQPYTMGSVTPLIQTPTPFSDLSIVNDTEKIHMLYIVRGMFRTQVVYQYKHSSAISTPRVIWEDNACENCLVSLQKGRVVLMWTVNGIPMRCVSENGGTSFGMVEKYTAPFPTKCVKAELLGAEEEAYNASECYGDGQNFFPAVYPLSRAPERKKAEPRRTPRPDDSRAYTALQESHKQEVEELSALLAQRSDEIAAVNARWKGQVEKLEREILNLREENARLKQSFLPTETEKSLN